ncbi:hypothetical protein [Candidatus Albibeggiatoa sp. nov. NOAA]|uniref:hypothetical protein n=1 Tax=Candidatus Albibeggiatoa sp. nov. NOAA TaxID=3162724 RepID=UPI0032F40F74|nr:hypothetical protein [Thiotrichaceae bacterium]
MALLRLFSQQNTQPPLFKPSVQPIYYPHIDLSYFNLGIDNVRIDTYLSQKFTAQAKNLIHELLEERTSTKKRFTDKPSDKVRKQLEQFAQHYADILQTAANRAKESKQIHKVQLLQLSISKFLHQTITHTLDDILQELRSSTMTGSQSAQSLTNYDRTKWIQNNKVRVLNQVSSEIFEQMRWIENSQNTKLRMELFGVPWSIPEPMLFSHLMYAAYENDLLLNKYIWLVDNVTHRFCFVKLQTAIDEVLAKIIELCPIKLASSSKKSYPSINNKSFTWRDNPDNMQLLFDTQQTQSQLSKTTTDTLQYKLAYQKTALQILDQSFAELDLLLPILAIYELPRLYNHYYHLLDPKLLFSYLCGEIDAQTINNKFKNLVKLKATRKSDNKELSINELSATQKRLRQALKQDKSAILCQFMQDFTAYRRDLKFQKLLQQKLESVHLLEDDSYIQLSRSNGILNEFLLAEEYTDEANTSIRCHVILKADLRGSTTIVSELTKRGLNPATHFNLHFFHPIRELIKDFGGEKVFIEGDAVILSFFEYQSQPEQWFAVARACGLAKSMLEVVAKQNQICQEQGLPILELGIGICYSAEAPAFLYDGDDRIMISPAIGYADRLSSCSWKLRQLYANVDLLTHVMVFQQPATDSFKGEKGMTTFRYNLNGVELDQTAFQKLHKEIALRSMKTKLPNVGACEIFVGQYQDIRRQSHTVVIRRSNVQLWQENTEKYPSTNKEYYEVVTNRKLLQAIFSKLGVKA